MKHFASITLLGLAVSLIAIAGCKPETRAFQSPLDKPISSTMSAQPTLVSPLPTSIITLTPTHPPITLSPTPTSIPETTGPLPPGVKVVYADHIHDGTVLLWAVSATDPDKRRLLAKANDPSDYGIHASISPDQTMIAYAALPSGNRTKRSVSDLWVVTIQGGEQRKLTSGIDIGSMFGYPLWSPDSRQLAFLRVQPGETLPRPSINLIDVRSGQEKTLVSAGDAGYLWPLGWLDRNGNFYYIQSEQQETLVKRVAIQTETIEKVAVIEGYNPACYFSSPDGQWLLCTVYQTLQPVKSAVIRVSLSGKPQQQVVGDLSEREGYYQPIWGPANQDVTVTIPTPGGSQSDLQVINVSAQTTRLLPLVQMTDLSFLPLSWSPDGEWLAAQEYARFEHDLYLISKSGEVRHIPGQGAVDVLGWISKDVLN